ncbi:MAG: dienelactone hydrolase family protein [Rhodospirillaceae bacterium]|jgi:carboxymethylenebutenolidase|nr:dienelactone hydrolase family protein [Rhodospirillaceae bacterium]MBT4938380.1 dienelactone hydrolase family protein [Rhodospirillaceae bacterium]MBT5939327.1 dienelactone hydrolase family protein [Rhodospirillaceae bacterium]MBT7265506.1 dienelactone hydrolase family protein [Rhodospirillaceae bacterium]
MPSSTIEYTTRDGEKFSGYLTKPEGDGPFPGILVITAIFGVDDEMKELADAWAADGFVVSVPDIFWRQVPGPTADMDVAFGRMNDFDPDQGMKDIEDLLGDLRGRSDCNGKAGILGFCFGGRYVHLSAARLGVDAGASYHGAGMGMHLDETDKITCPMSLHFGAEDPVIPTDEINAIKAAHANHPKTDIGVYEGVEHNFSMPYKPGYDEGAAKASRAAALIAFQSM